MPATRKPATSPTSPPNPHAATQAVAPEPSRLMPYPPG
jgi:hypothetical protein